jgi:hypothetical protein
MKAQRAEILSQFAQHGWQIVEAEGQALEWWADEICCLESAWPPIGTRAYICFLIQAAG